MTRFPRNHHRGRPVRRGDNIPSISEYAHWNEDAERVWYEENRYDMEHADEVLEDEFYEATERDEPYHEESFLTRAEAEAFAKTVKGSWWIREWPALGDMPTVWTIEHDDHLAHRRRYNSLHSRPTYKEVNT